MSARPIRDSARRRRRRWSRRAWLPLTSTASSSKSVGVDAVGVLDAGVPASFALEPAELELLPVLCVLVPDPDLCCLGLPPDELLDPPLESRTAINTPIARAASRISTGTIPVDRRRGGRLGGGTGRARLGGGTGRARLGGAPAAAGAASGRRCRSRSAPARLGRARGERLAQPPDELARGGGTISRVGGHPSLQDGCRRRGSLRPEVAQIGRRLGGDRMCKSERIGLGASLLTGEHLEGHRRERVDVHAGRRRRAVQLLGRHVAEAAHERAGAGDVGPVGDIGDAQIGQLHGALASEQDVGRLDVAVHDPARVNRIQSGGDAFENPQQPHRGASGRWPARRLSRVSPSTYSMTITTSPSSSGLGVVDGDEIGVVERGPDERLALEPQRAVRIAGAVNALERDLAAQQHVLGERHRGHAAGAEALDLDTDLDMAASQAVEFHADLESPFVPSDIPYR